MGGLLEKAENIAVLNMSVLQSFALARLVTPACKIDVKRQPNLVVSGYACPGASLYLFLIYRDA